MAMNAFIRDSSMGFPSAHRGVEQGGAVPIDRGPPGARGTYGLMGALYAWGAVILEKLS